jgi:hypothetical protein
MNKNSKHDDGQRSENKQNGDAQICGGIGRIIAKRSLVSFFIRHWYLVRLVYVTGASGLAPMHRESAGSNLIQTSSLYASCALRLLQ